MRGEKVLTEKSFDFATKIVKLCKLLGGDERSAERKELVMSKQLLRSGTCVGASIREGTVAESNNDFIHKMSVSLKECKKSMYWIELLHTTGYMTDDEFASIQQDAEKLIKMLTKVLADATKKGLK